MYSSTWIPFPQNFRHFKERYPQWNRYCTECWGHQSTSGNTHRWRLARYWHCGLFKKPNFNGSKLKSKPLCLTVNIFKTLQQKAYFKQYPHYSVYSLRVCSTNDNENPECFTSTDMHKNGWHKLHNILCWHITSNSISCHQWYLPVEVESTCILYKFGLLKSYIQFISRSLWKALYIKPQF